ALLLSVRSGARASMPGMMDTVLNLGLNDETAAGLARSTGDARFAYDSYRRFIQMYADVVMGVGRNMFETLIEEHKDRKKVHLDVELDADDWMELCAEFKKLIGRVGGSFPQSPRKQLWGAIGAVFDSWMNRRAVIYRKLHDIPENWGTAVNIQAMVFGNMGDDCATGVCFTRNPATGENNYYGEFLANAQGEDVVAGIRTPQPLTIAERQTMGSNLPSLEETMPAAYAELLQVRETLEGRYKDMQDMEFTIQQGKLWMLQTRTGKRTARAALKISVDMTAEGLIDEKEAIRRIDPAQLDQLLHPTIDPDASRNVLARGLPASPGAACGRVVFNSPDAEAWAGRGEKVILVRVETSPEDIGGMHVAQGILTTRGGMTSHAAVVARGMGTPAVSGAGEIHVDDEAKLFTVLGETVREGDIITLDGSLGEVILGEAPTIQPNLSGDFARIMEWADKIRRLGVRANAETPEDAETARRFGAEGIGLCRTEHMFFDPERLVLMRRMILASDGEQRRRALQQILPFQRRDFLELFTIMDGLPVTVRLLDPPLHEFLPHTEKETAEVARAAGVDIGLVRARAAELRETNPMLGLRGCRLGITFPEIYEMQVRAIIGAAVEARKAGGKVEPEIMVPLISHQTELAILKEMIDRVAAEVMTEAGENVAYLVGAMIELPRAALGAGAIAGEAEFFSFGTNDLTQATYGLSRDDAAPFIDTYRDQGIFDADPFQTLDVDGVGELIKIAVLRGREARPDIKLGICGEHGGDPASVRFFHRAGLDYVSCSPYRVPVARLAAAQAALGPP
ncbi:MAG TPA: pyruvate, phosphate dikinase, partial [Alphaproteobacteria bacterium]|nr:pyruvate, phosphate dikinase [Alphaproteobacteria bacterium]